MADSKTYLFSGDRIGLIVRGKASHADHPGVLDQHADCILSNGAPIGFFGDVGGGSSSSGSSGLGLRGMVFDYAEFRVNRPAYVDQHVAATYNVRSTVLIIAVTPSQAGAFDKYWRDLDTSPSDFSIVGANCSTRASESFLAAGLLAGGIPGLDTPDHLYAQLCREQAGSCWGVSGYVGFTPYGSGYLCQVDTP